MRQLFLDQVPDDAGHFIAIEFNHGVGDFYLGHLWNLIIFGLEFGVAIAGA